MKLSFDVQSVKRSIQQFAGVAAFLVVMLVYENAASEL